MDTAEIDAILEHARARERKAPEPPADVMYKAVNAAMAKAAKAHRLATETVEIKVFEC